MLNLVNQLAPNNPNPLSLVFGIEFCQQVNGVNYALNNGRYNKEEIQNPKLEIYNIKHNSWSSITLKNQCYRPAAEIVGDKLFVAGGTVRDMDEPDYRFIRVSDVFIYQLNGD